MLHWWIKRRIAAFERAYNYDMSYARELLEIDREAFMTFSKVMGLSQYCKDLPKPAWMAAKLVGTMTEDCGPCTQLVVTMAEREGGMSPESIRAILERNPQAMPDDVALGFRFAEAVLAHAPEADALRDQIVAQWGRRALISLGFALTSARMYPTLKYAMGSGKACTRVSVGGTFVPVTQVHTHVV